MRAHLKDGCSLRGLLYIFAEKVLIFSESKNFSSAQFSTNRAQSNATIFSPETELGGARQRAYFMFSTENPYSSADDVLVLLHYPLQKESDSITFKSPEALESN